MAEDIRNETHDLPFYAIPYESEHDGISHYLSGEQLFVQNGRFVILIALETQNMFFHQTYSLPADTQICHPGFSLRRSIQHSSFLGSAARSDLSPQEQSHPASRTVLLKMNLVNRPDIDSIILQVSPCFFLKARWTAESLRAIVGRGFRNLKPSSRNIRWHCRTPKSILNLFLTYADSTLPSQIPPVSPTSSGLNRSATPISEICSLLNFRGRPDFSSSTSP